MLIDPSGTLMIVIVIWGWLVGVWVGYRWGKADGIKRECGWCANAWTCPRCERREDAA